VAWEWVLIVSAVAGALWAANVWATLAAVVLIGTRQHALLVLMHEFSHRQFSRTRPVLNDTLGDLLTALPLLITVHGFRRDHWQHHAHTATQDDPNWVSTQRQARYAFPKSEAGLAWELIKHALGVYTVREVKTYLFQSKMSIGCPAATQARQLMFALLVLATVAYFDAWSTLGLYWFLPMFTVLMALLYVRDIGEHLAMPRQGLSNSRTVLVGKLEGWLVAPYGVGCHAEHHLYPSVPGHRLPELHHLLMRKPSPWVDAQAVVTHGYFSGVRREAMRHANLAKPHQSG
jgi:fatty acid desaturase